MKKLATFAFLLAVFLSACASAPAGEGFATPIKITAEVSTVIPEGGGSGSTLPPPEPPTPVPTLAGGLSVTELKYRVLEEYPDFFFCDPDYYPIAREDETVLAQQAFPDLQANQEEFQVILSHIGLSGQTTFTGEQKLQVYREHKRLNAISFELLEDNYRFQIQTGREEGQGTLVTGTIEAGGSIDVLHSEPAFLTCPICLAAGTLVDTPRGPVRVEDLRVGDPIWTQDEAGRRVSASLTRTGRARVPAGHLIVHVLLEDGRNLWASPGHPTADGRRLGELVPGDVLDGSSILQVERVPYEQLHTFDILPSGGTGFYWANGILMGSTLHRPELKS